MKRIPSTLEALEPRIAPANVAAALINSVLVVKPIDPAQGIVANVVQTSADTFEVFDDGVSLGVFEEVSALRIRGGLRGDFIGVDPLPDAADRFLGPVTLVAGGGRFDDIFIASGTLGGDVRAVASQQTLVATGITTVVAGTLRITSTGPGSEAFLQGQFADVFMTGLKGVELGALDAAGDMQIVARENSYAQLHLGLQTRVTGDFTFALTGSAGSFIEAGDTIVGGAMSFRLGGGDHTFSLVGVTVGGGLQVASGAGRTTALISEAIVQGNAIFRLGGDRDLVSIGGGSQVGGTVKMLGSATSESTFLEVHESSISGAVTMLTSNGGLGLNLFGATILGGITLRGADGPGGLITDEFVTLAGKVDVETGDGGFDVVIREVGELTRVRFIGGEGENNFQLFGTGGQFLRVFADLGGGREEARILCADFVSVVLDGGDGNDVLVEPERLTGPNAIARNFERFVQL